MLRATAAACAEAEAERDQAVAECNTYQRRWQQEYLAATELRHRATRLVALEQAARAWAETFTTGPAQEPWFTPWQALHDAVRALDAPPADTAPA